MTSTINSADPTFTADWNEGNGHIKPVKQNPLLAWLLSPLKEHAKKSTLLSSWYFTKSAHADNLTNFRRFWSEAPESRVQELYRMEEVSVQAADGAVLSAYCFRHQLADPETRTVLLFNPNCSTSTQMPYGWLLEEMASRGTPCNFVSFDYRTVADSSGELLHANDFCIDADAMLQFIEAKLGTPRNKIALYGWSLGGAVAANAAQLQPNSKAPVVLERTFSTTSKVVIKGLSILHRIGQFFLSLILRSIRWEMDTATPTKKMLGEGRPVMVIHHPEDPRMKKAASLYGAIKGVPSPSLCPVSLGVEGDDPAPSWVNHHVAPLNWYTTKDDVTMASIAADFLLRE